MSDQSIILLVVVAYLLAMIAVGIAARPRSATKEEYYVAGRRLPFWVVAFSMNATGESAWLLLGLSGLAYTVGVSAIWVVVGETIGIWLSWNLLARRMNAVARRSGAVTVTDVLVTAVGDPHHLLRVAASLIVLVMVLVYVAAQMLATGKAFESFLGWPYIAGVLTGGAVTMLYTSLGGFRGVAYTDTVQALLMLFAVLAVPVAGLVALGGIGAAEARLADAGAYLLAPIDLSQGHTVGLIALASALAVGLPFLGVPMLLARYIALSHEEAVPRARAVSVLVIGLLGTGAVATGVIGRALIPALDDAETIMPLLSEQLFPPLITGLLVAAVLSAVMSTVSSLMNLLSSALVGDFYHQVLRPSADTSTMGRMGVQVTLLVGLAGTGLALVGSGLIYTLVLFAWAGLGAAFGPVMLCALRWRGTTWQGALAGMLGGFAVTVIWMAWVKPHVFDLYEMIPGFLSGLCLTLAVSMLTSRRGGDLAGGVLTSRAVARCAATCYARGIGPAAPCRRRAGGN
jgi:sodium/proline symporter